MAKPTRSPVLAQPVNRSSAPRGVNRNVESNRSRPRKTAEGRSVSMASAGTVASAGAAGGNADVRAQQPFGLSDLARVVRARGAIIRNVTLAVVAATIVVLLLLPTMYSGTAVVMLDPRKNNVAGLSSVLTEVPTDPASVQNQIAILSSRDL